MEKYKKILIALELNTKTDHSVIKKALELHKACGGQLFLVHAIEYISGYGYGLPYSPVMTTEVEDMLYKHAQKEMEKIGAGLHINAEQQIVQFGSAKFVILDVAEKLKTDLIVLGSHGKHGVRMLLGSTANAVLHGAKCDVLAVRLAQ